MQRSWSLQNIEINDNISLLSSPPLLSPLPTTTEIHAAEHINNMSK